MTEHDAYIRALAEFLFVEHDGTSPVTIKFPERVAKSSKDLFRCFLDLLFEGLVLRHGGPDGELPVHHIRWEQLEDVRSRLACMGVYCDVSVDGPFEDPPLTVRDATEKMMMFHTQPSDMPLDQYTYEVVSANFLYRVRFQWRAPSAVREKCKR